MKIKWEWLAAGLTTPLPSASHVASASMDPKILVSLPELTIGLIAVIIAGTVLMILLLLVLFSAIKAKKKIESDKDTEEAKVGKENEAPDIGSIRRMVAQQIEQALHEYKPKPQASVFDKDEESFVSIKLSEKENLILAVDKINGGYILKEKEPPMTEARVTYKKEGLETDKLVITDKRSGLVVEYNPDSIWAYLDLEYPSLTEDGVNDDKLELFFNFGDIPPSPTAFDVQVVKKARMERRGMDFYLAEKGEVQVTEK
ncbi:MAG: hypothetical protein AB1Z19_01735 [Eubacteriales bacterium]